MKATKRQYEATANHHAKMARVFTEAGRDSDAGMAVDKMLGCIKAAGCHIGNCDQPVTHMAEKKWGDHGVFGTCEDHVPGSSRPADFTMAYLVTKL